ncbi:MAG TPA: hypothetical protein VFK05_14770 [Polyangiaceae bacterium]|nr:hypothetical protein [Polyangiaceae bacterium]
MKASRVARFGGPEVIELQDVALPIPGDGEVLVRIAAAGVGPWDAWVRSGCGLASGCWYMERAATWEPRSATLVTRVGLVLPLQEARVAHEMLDGKRERPPGKIVLRVSELES